jgi:hypothetical protein
MLCHCDRRCCVHQSREFAMLRSQISNQFHRLHNPTKITSHSTLRLLYRPYRSFFYSRIISSHFSFQRKQEFGFLKNQIEKVKEYFGLDEVSQQKKKEEKLLNDMIDNSLKGVGLFGGVVGFAVKTLLKATTNLTKTAMKEMSSDLEFIQHETERILSENHSAVQVLGDNIQCHTPYHISSNTSNINGAIKKRFQLRMTVEGSKESSVVSVDATIEQEELYLNSILFQTKSSKFDIECGDKPAKKRVVIDA